MHEEDEWKRLLKILEELIDEDHGMDYFNVEGKAKGSFKYPLSPDIPFQFFSDDNNAYASLIMDEDSDILTSRDLSMAQNMLREIGVNVHE